MRCSLCATTAPSTPGSRRTRNRPNRFAVHSYEARFPVTALGRCTFAGTLVITGGCAGRNASVSCLRRVYIKRALQQFGVWLPTESGINIRGYRYAFAEDCLRDVCPSAFLREASSRLLGSIDFNQQDHQLLCIFSLGVGSHFLNSLPLPWKAMQLSQVIKHVSRQ